MSEEPVIGGGSAPDESTDGEAEAVTPETDASEAELAELLRETLLAAHDDLAAEDLEGETPAEVRERYVATRARLDQEAGETREAPVPAGAPGRFAPAPGTAFEKIREGLTRLNA
ncbi:MAG: hypothetical protein F4Z77_10825 [Dehalococcoidia bacterium]|nr:hypothetical protein [Dehalococcoidia bacterium]MYA52214.1 hypothetical protein [Dehalococcoidia bacterium]